MIPFAHALASKGDLPIPAWLFAWGAAIVLVVSFFGLAAAWRKPKFEGDEWRPIAPRFSAVLLSRAAQFLFGLASVCLLGVVLYAGFEGTSAPDRNFALVFVFVTVWLGFPVASALLGDVFRAVNPWRALGRAGGWIYQTIARQDPVHLTYPERLGRWPAAVGLVAFVWLEIIYGSAGTSISLSPQVVAEASVFYTAYTLVMMILFGTETWIKRGEFLSVYFNMFSTLAALEVRDGKLGRRPLLSGTTGWANVPGSVALVISAIGVTTFDGAQEGALKSVVESLQDFLHDSGLGITAAVRGADTIIMLLVLAGVAAIYFAGIWGMRGVKQAPSFPELRRLFGHTLIPIALAYLVAHYFSLFYFQEQAQFTFLLSDPLGTGTTDLFGTADHGIDYNSMSTSLIWYIQLGALLAGHVSGLVLAHDKALSIWSDIRVATRAQYWMLVVMVGFTCLGLALLSIANQ